MITDEEMQIRHKERIAALESKQLKRIEDRLAHLDAELVLRNKLSSKPLDPKFEYETDSEWLKHIVIGVELAVEEEMLRLESERSNILSNQEQRMVLEHEISKKENGPDYN